MFLLRLILSLYHTIHPNRKLINQLPSSVIRTKPPVNSRKEPSTAEAVLVLVLIGAIVVATLWAFLGPTPGPSTTDRALNNMHIFVPDANNVVTYSNQGTGMIRWTVSSPVGSQLCTVKVKDMAAFRGGIQVPWACSSTQPG